MRIAVYLMIFWAMQVVAQVFFKWGSTSEPRWLWGFLGGNLFGFSSIWLLMLLYKEINPNVALGIATGGAFLITQVVLFLVFKTEVAPMQWAGVAAIVFGMIVMLMGAPQETRQDAKINSADPHSVALHDGR